MSKAKQSKSAKRGPQKAGRVKARQNVETRKDEVIPVPFDQETVAALQACLDHASHLLDSARVVLASGHPNIAYHLATFTLEEVGRRELIGVQTIAKRSTVPPAWPLKHTQDHVQKLFWCFFGGGFFSGKLTGAKIEEMRDLARNIHFNRLAGLYVDQGETGVSIPSEAISTEDAKSLIEFAGASVDLIASERPRKAVPQDEIEPWPLNPTP